MNKYITINNKEFLINNKIDDKINNIKDLYSCYASPSITKINIYNNWYKFFNELDVNNIFTINSYNCMQFTIKSIFTYNSKKYVAYITKKYNYIKDL